MYKRQEPGWAYGFAELSPEFRKNIAENRLIANPGCYASGFISIVYPLKMCIRDRFWALFRISFMTGANRIL